jgi:hypothetical protein
LERAVDPPTRTAVIYIKNSGALFWKGTTNTFGGSEPWVGPYRTIIGGDDPELKKAPFVWDTVSVIWSHELTNCQAEVSRQYITPRQVKSGFRDVHNCDLNLAEIWQP